jgi:hypothetical protein
MPSTLATRLRLQIILVLILCFPGMATAPCRDNTLAKAKVVVEARVKSLSPACHKAPDNDGAVGTVCSL